MTPINELISRLRALNVNITVRDEALSIRAGKGVLTPALTGELSARKADLITWLKQAGRGTGGEGDSIPLAPKDAELRLSHGQQRLWFLDRLEGPSATYVMPLAVHLEGRLDVEALERALIEITRRHEVLRTNFAVVDERVSPQIDENAYSCLMRCGAGDAPAEEISRRVQHEAQRCFDLASDRLVHAALMRVSETKHLFFLTMHHIISDGWSIGVFIRELAQLYEAYSQGRASPLPELPIQYRDYAHWQYERLQGEVMAEQIAYWRRQLAGAPDMIALATDRPRPAIQTYRGECFRSTLDAALTSGLRMLGRIAGATLFMTLLSGFALLLSRYSGQNDILTGTIVANRTHPDLEALIGLFINTLVLRLDFSGDPSARTMIERTRNVCLQAFGHQDLPFERLVEELKPERTLSYAPLIQVSFDLQNAPVEKIEISGLNLLPVQPPVGAAKFDLSLTVEETGDELSAVWTYNPDLFDEATIAGMNAHYRRLLAGMAANPDAALSVLPMLEEDDQRRLVYELNETCEPYPRGEQTIVSLFAATAGRWPDRVAVCFGGESITYRELQRHVNSLAARLLNAGVGPETLVGLYADRSLEMVIGLFAVLTAGGAYIPLDPAYPRERLLQVLDDARPAFVLTQAHLQNSLPETAAQLIFLNRDTGLAACKPAQTRAANLAYVIYTSGSTGRPKGVAVSHGALLNLLLSMQREPGLTVRDTLLAVTTVAFDIAALEIYLPLITGGRLVIAAPDETLDARLLQAVIQSRGITCMQATPATWRLLVETGWKPPPSFTCLCGGEALPKTLASELLQKGVRLWNLYGPTETTIWSAVREVEQEAPDVRTLEPIGHPIANTQIYILNTGSQPQPAGVPGELCIAGDGLARGYLNRPGLTASSYRPNPFAVVPGARLYRTGDLTRRLRDGRIGFLGRIDRQVKIRGFRIETGDIEAALRTLDGVSDAAVTVREGAGGDKHLVAYLVTEQKPAPAAKILRESLQAMLPAYMIPAAIVFLAAMPLSANGKIDWRALPAPEAGGCSPASGLVMARTELETLITGIWRKALGAEQIGIDDNFFALGGHSLLLARMHESLRTCTDKPFPLVTLFQYPTIRSLAAWLAEENAPAPLRIRAPASPAPGSNRDIAVIGLAGCFPGADTLEAFWANLQKGQESIQFFSESELLAAGMEPGLIAQPNYVRANGSLSDIAGFDAAFFGIPPGEAEIMDPQHRLFLEIAWHALENAGYAADASGSAIGVFAGCSHNRYFVQNLLPALLSGDSQTVYQHILGNEKDFLTARVSYALNLTGPSVNVQTACSTSLVAVHLACKSLIDGECEMALAGGVALKIPQASGYLYEEGMIQSPDGHCRAFDADAQGTTWGSGGGVVLLKPLGAALADRDTVHAVIKGSAINNDGSVKVSFTAPSVERQAEVIASALARAGVSPGSISYVEAHGTGTRLGDPIEVAALTRAFRTGTGKRQFCALGSVKTNIGHLDAAAGIAGLCKTILALRRQQIPPTLHFNSGNREIDFANSPFFVANKLRDWVSDGAPRCAGVSSFGLGGTNAHVIVEEAPGHAAAISTRPCQLLIISARSETALSASCLNLAEHLADDQELVLADAAFTLARGRRAFSHRAAVVATNAREAAPALETLSHRKEERPPQARTPPSVVFMFPGQGAQYPGMGVDLYRTEPVFHEEIDRCAELLLEELGHDIRTALYPEAQNMDTAEQLLAQTWLTQPALFATEYALARLWLSWGVQPAAMIGHSLGEFVAACLAGVFGLATGLRLVARRGRLLQEHAQGSMLAVTLSAQDMRPLLANGLALAAINSVEDSVVSGPLALIEALAARLNREGIPCRLLHTSLAAHSALVEPALPLFLAELRKIKFKPPVLPYVSNVTGTWIRPEEATDPLYWARHMRETVDFKAGIGTLLEGGNRVLLEVGPGAALGSFVRRHPSAANGSTALASLLRPRPTPPERPSGGESRTIQEALGRLWSTGLEVDWTAYFAHERLSRVPLPAYPFDKQRYWIDPPENAAPPPGGLRGGEQPFDTRFYLAHWKPALAPRADLSGVFGAKPHLWLVLSDDSLLSCRLIERLDKAGQEIIIARAADHYAREGRNFCIRPTVPGDYAALIEAAGREIYKVLHFWSLSPADQREPGDFHQAQARGYYSLLYLGQALARLKDVPPITIAVIANHLHDVNGAGEAWAEKATLLGPCLVMPQETPLISCRCLDIALPPEGAEAPLAERLLTEIESKSTDPFVAYRGKQRLTLDFIPVSLDPDKYAVRQLRQRGVYVIIGGLGNAGLVLARLLASDAKARVALIGQSYFPERAGWDAWLHESGDDNISSKIRAIRDIEALGGDVVTIQADAANAQQMREAFTRINAQFGAIHGVIHAAGALRDPSFVTLFNEVTEETTRAQFRAKIDGLYVLQELLHGQELDFCLTMSSNAAVLGGPGFTAYSAANHFIDAYVCQQNLTAATPWLTASWDALIFDTTSGNRPGTECSLDTQDFAAAFLRVVSCAGAGRVIIAAGDLSSRFDQWVRRPGAPELWMAKPRHTRYKRPALATSFAAPASEAERALVSIWQDALGFTAIGVEDDFFELGGDSLSAIRLMSLIKRQFRRECPLSVILGHRTIRELAKTLEQSTEAAVASPLVAVQPKGVREPFFCVPGTGGAVVYFNELAHRLIEWDRPFYGLQASGLNGQTRPHSSVEEIAAENIRALQKIQPRGPYYLGGHSFGSWVAFEMARRLQAEGHKVAPVAILDTAAPSARDLAAMNAQDDAKWVLAVANTLSKIYEKPLVLQYNQLVQMTWADQIEALIHEMEEQGIVQPGTQQSDIRGFVEVYRTQALIRYLPDPEPRTPVVLFRAREPLDEFTAGIPAAMKDDESWGWNRYSEGAPLVEYVPGNHLTMVNSPHAAVLAERLRATISCC